MFNRKLPLGIILATTFLTPIGAYADTLLPSAVYTGNSGPGSYSDVEINLGVLGGLNPDQAGRYNGLNTSGVFVNGGFSLNSVPSSTSPWFFHLNGWNLNFQPGTQFGSHAGNGSNFQSNENNVFANGGDINASFGKQGAWTVQLDAHSITWTGNAIDSIYDFNGNTATLNPGLTPWGGATATAAGPIVKTHYTVLNLPQYMATYQAGTRRDVIAGNFSYDWSGWTFTAAITHEHKYGTLENSSDGAWGGTAFTQPVDYDTDRYDLTAFYATPLNQIQVKYTLSNFTDKNNYFALPFPYSNTAAPFQETEAYSAPPSNLAQYLTLEYASNMIPKTHVSLNLQLGLETQNTTSPPDTADPNLTAAQRVDLNSNLSGTTAASPNMSAKIYNGDFEVYTHPFDSLDGRVYYGMNGRYVTLNQFGVYGGGTGGSSQTAFTTKNYVVPQDWLKEDAGGEVGYDVLPASETKLTLGYRADLVNRSNAQVGNSTTNTATAALTSALASDIFGRLSYTYSNRSGSLSYNNAWDNLSNGVGAAPGELCSTCSGAYYQAPMVSNATELMLSYTIDPQLSTSLFGEFENDNFTYPADGGKTLTGVGEGIKQDYHLDIGPDVEYRPSATTSVHAFYTFERIFYNNLGNGNCAASKTGACAGSAGYFQNKDTTDLQTVGIDGTWQVTDRLKLGARETVSYGSVMFGEFNGVFVASPTASYQNVSNYPDIDSLMNDLDVTATYEIHPGLTAKFQAEWMYFRENNWYDYAASAQGAGTTAISFLTPGYGSPNYSDALAMIGVQQRF